MSHAGPPVHDINVCSAQLIVWLEEEKKTPKISQDVGGEDIVIMAYMFKWRKPQLSMTIHVPCLFDRLIIEITKTF